MYKRLIMILFVLMMSMILVPSAMAETGASDNGEEISAEEAVAAFEELDKGEYAPGEVIVLFEEDAVRERETGLKSARKLDEIDSSFGELMQATGEAEEAADAAKSEVSIIKESLGENFVIKDSISFDEELTMCLVSSDSFDTETMIRKLSENAKVRSVEANTYIEPKSAEYSLNDALNQYAYQTNSPADTNTGGKNVSGRGTPAEDTLSIRTGSVTDFTVDHSSEDEVVVAVVDSGINTDHEDLKDMLWVNPGNIGLEGVNGFNFDDNAELVEDRFGHGTHCSGIIAAQANNGKGVAGTASGVNVKIMMLAVSGSILDEEGEYIQSDVSTAFRTLGAFNYALKAKQRGVNVVATSNSWGTPGDSFVYDEAFDRLGEEGVLSFVAASNDALDIDRYHYSPPGGDSLYMVSVGSADVSGKPSGFSDYGKVNVDLFAPGQNILSTSAKSLYFPSLYPASERAENTEYYGMFSSETEVGANETELGTNHVVPETGDGAVKPFGAMKFFKQKSAYIKENPWQGDEPESTCEVSISEDKHFTDNFEPGSEARPASLKVTIRNARADEDYFVYFPYEKNPLTTGVDNTRYSITSIFQHKKDEFTAMVSGGEIVRHEKDGESYCTCDPASDHECNTMYDNEIINYTSNRDGDLERTILSWEEADPATTDVIETGIGLHIRPSAMTDPQLPEDAISEDEIRDITVYIDSLGVSKPVTEEGKTPEDVFPAETSYELMSGTSQATPAAAGAYAVLTALYPKQEGQTGSGYALESRERLFASVRETEAFKGMCSTGGYIDLGMVKEDGEKPSIIDAVCDLKAGTLTLIGRNLSEDLQLSCRSLAEKDAQERTLPDGKMKVMYAKDGTKIRISNAKELFGRYTEFLLRSGDTVRARGSFFTVKGQTKIEKVLTEELKDSFYDSDVTLPPRHLFTDTKGKTVYGYNVNSGSIYDKTSGLLFKYDGSKFIEYKGTKLKDAVFDYYEQELGYDRHQITRGLRIEPMIVRQPVYENDILYDFVKVEYTPHLDAEPEDVEQKTYLAALDYTAKAPKWTFTEITSVEEAFSDLETVNTQRLTFCIMDGKIYCFGSIVGKDDEITDENNFTFVYALDISSGKWERKNDLKGIPLSETDAYRNQGKIWLMFGIKANTPSYSVYGFDGENWNKVTDIPFIGRVGALEEPVDCAVAPVKEGLVLFNYSVEGAGNVSLLNTTTGRIEPLYFTGSDGLSDPMNYESGASAVETKDGLFMVSLTADLGGIARIDMYRIPKTSYAYTPTYKSPNPAKITKKNLTVKSKALKKKAVKKTAVKVKNAAGTVTYKRAKITCSKKLLASAKKNIIINAKTGKVTVGKGLSKGRYTVSVKVRAKGDLIYDPLAKTVKFKITVK